MTDPTCTGEAGECLVTAPVRGYRWRNIIFFAVTHLIGIFGTPLYIHYYGLSPAVLCLTLFYFVATGMAVTFGYHRLFSHRNYETNRFIEFLVLFFGAASFEESALTWCAQHRAHHQYVDTDLDPYSIKKGFFYAHMGWMMFWIHPKYYHNAKDLKKNPLIMHQFDHYVTWAALGGIVVPFLLGLALGYPGGALIVVICARITAVYQGTFCINSVCHTFGKGTYDHTASAKDNWFTAFYTWGEGYHSFHHRFPNDYRNGVRWYQWDPTKWLIAAFSMVGLTRNLKRACPFRILRARITAESHHAEYLLSILAKHHENAARLLDVTRERYEQLQSLLHDWEGKLKDFRHLKLERPEGYMRMVERASFQMKLSRERFREAYREWQSHLEEALRLPQTVLVRA